MPDTAALLELEEVTVNYAQPRTLRVLDRLSLTLRAGRIGCLLGPSGCGKTTALRVIAGFERPVGGRVRIDGEIVSSPDRMLPPERRNVGVVFQDFALFPHLTVADNIGFGLRQLSGSARARRVAELLDMVGLPGAGDRFPHEISGGQQQRVALARALAPRPRLLLLDEPFSSLDPELREKLALEVRTILQAHGTTALLVTHDQYEAFAMADEIGVMQDGRIAQWDTPYDLYHRPATEAVADFVGMGVILRGYLSPDGTAVDIKLGRLPIRDRGEQAAAGASASARREVSVLMRPDDVVHDDASPLRAKVLRKAFRGAQFLYTLELDGGEALLALVPSHHDHAIGEWIGVRVDADHVITFPI